MLIGRRNPLTDEVNQEQKPLNKRQQAKAETKRKITEAARELFATEGYAKTTIRDIAKRVGMSTGAVFANFASKEALFVYGLGLELAAYNQLRQQVDFHGAAFTRDINALISDFAFWSGRHRLLEEARYLEGLGNEDMKRLLAARRDSVLGPSTDRNEMVFFMLWSMYDAAAREAMIQGLAYEEFEPKIKAIVEFVYFRRS